MVATFPESDESKATLFKYLKRYQPKVPHVAPDLAATAAGAPVVYALPIKQRKQPYLSRLIGSAQIAVIALGFWVSALPLPIALKTTPATTAPPQNDLWHTLGSDTLAQALLAEQEKQTKAALAAAEQERLQAQQLRLDAEAQAQNLTDSAANRVRRMTVEAVRQADLIALDATYIGAEQVLYAEAGNDITLKFTARIQCKEGAFGETAVATPVDPRIATREVRNLATCYPSVETAAGQPIGEAGEWGVAFFKRPE